MHVIRNERRQPRRAKLERTDVRIGGIGACSVSLDSARRVIALARLDSIALDSMTAALLNEGADDRSNIALTLEYTATAENIRSDRFRVLARIRVEASAEGKSVADVVATYRLLYTIPKGLEPSIEELNSFARVNGIHNAWPYWRELIQSVLSRMGLPPVVIPLFRLVPKSAERSGSDQSSDDRPVALER